MKPRYILIFFLICFYSSYGQEDLIRVITNQAVVIDSLKRTGRMETENFNKQSRDCLKNLKSQSDTIKNIKLELSKLEKFKAEKNKVDTSLKQKNDSIRILKKQYSEVNKQIIEESKKTQIALREEYNKGKNEIKIKIVETYKNKNFDELLQSSSKISVQRDLLLVDNNEIKNLLNDLILYFDATLVLEKRYKPEQVKNTQLLLNKINHQSDLLERLKVNIENYETSSKALLECLMKIDKLNEKTVYGMPKDLFNDKLNKIQMEISKYIFDYDLNFAVYPYLSDIVFDVIKIKNPNPDASITELIKKIK